MANNEPSPVVDARPARAVVSLIFKPAGGSFRWPDFDTEFHKIKFTELDSLGIAEIAPRLEAIQNASRELIDAGFVIEAATEVGLSFSGTREEIRRYFGFDPFECGSRQDQPSYVGVSNMPPPPTPLRDDVRGGIRQTCAGFEVAVPGVLAWASEPPQNPGPTEIMGLRECLGLLGVGDGVDGAGVHVRLVDSGFADDWPQVRPMAGGARPTDVQAIGELDPTCDESGHGTAVAAHVLAVAPKCTLSMRKFVDESGVRNYPVAAFQSAVASHPVRPDVILCSWVVAGTSLALQLEIANAVRKGILVVFASGNAKMHDEKPRADAGIALFTSGTVEGDVPPPPAVTYKLCPIAHPDVLSVGGVAKRESSSPEFSASDYTPVAAHFQSRAFVYQGERPRNCPDIVGLTAPESKSALELPGLIVTPTSVGSTMDRKPDGSDRPRDGMYKSAGTSMAAGQVAGIAALLIGSVQELRGLPASVKNVLTNTARHDADQPWDTRTGHGVAWASDALAWLGSELDPFIRTGDYDPSDPKTNSPDIILVEYADPLRAQRRLGQCFKHMGGVELDGPERLNAFVRVQNRGKHGGGCRVSLAMSFRSLLSPPNAPDVITHIGDKAVHLEPGCFMVVGPFVLPDELPSGAILLAEAVRSADDDSTSQLEALVAQGALTKSPAELEQLGVAIRGV
jgi:hypothetical protein